MRLNIILVGIIVLLMPNLIGCDDQQQKLNSEAAVTRTETSTEGPAVTEDATSDIPEPSAESEPESPAAASSSGLAEDEDNEPPAEGAQYTSGACRAAGGNLRSSGGTSGSSFVRQVSDRQGVERDNAVVRQVLSGSVPAGLTRFVPVQLSGGGNTITICVAPDYLSIGNDQDNVRFPMGLPATFELVRQLDLLIPTTKMVDAIYAQANVKLQPSTKDPNGAMESTRYINEHDQTIDEQLGERTGLIGGHKKDLVITRRLINNPGRVAIYGWHYPSGERIQPLSTVHHRNYADYSHGIRLISKTAFLNGEQVSLVNLLRDSNYAGILSSEGVLDESLLR